jgi:Zn-finger protein
MWNLYRGPSISAPYQVSVHLVKLFQRRFFRNQSIRNKNCLWWPCLLTDRDEMSNFKYSTFHRCFLPSFDSFGKTVSEEKNFKNQSIRNENCLWRPCLLIDREEMSNLYRGPPIDYTYQVSVHLAQRFQRRFFRNQSIRNKNCLWRPCLWTDRDEMSNLYRGPSKDASYQVSIHLAKRFQRRRILKISQSETRVACGGHVC